MVTLDFTYSKKDIVRAYRLHYRGKLNLPFDIAALVAASGSALYLYKLGGRFQAFTLLCLAFVLTLMILSVFFVIPPLMYYRGKKKNAHYHIELSEEEIHFQMDKIDSKIEWRLYDRAVTDRHSCILYYGNNRFTILPRSALPDDAARQELERLVALKIKNIKRL